MDFEQKNKIDRFAVYNIFGSDLFGFLSCKCKNPSKRINRNGVSIWVPCGHCEQCLSRSRQEMTFRLKSEMHHPNCIKTYFVTLTYGNRQDYDVLTDTFIDSGQRSCPYLPKVTLDNLRNGVPNPDPNFSDDLLSRYDIDDNLVGYYENISKGFNTANYVLRVCRGALPSSLASGDNVGLIYPRDFQLFMKLVRSKFYRKFSKDDYIIRYRCLGHYGQTDGRTYAPHFHIILYLFATSPKVADFVKNDTPLFQTLDNWFHDDLLNCWTHSKRQIKGNKVIGKDCEDILNDNVGCYVSRYIDRLILYNIAPGAKYVPPFTSTSRLNRKHDIGAIGSSFLDKPNIKPYLLDALEKSIYNDTFFSFHFTEDKIENKDFIRVIPKTLKYNLIYKRFGITPSEFARFIKLKNQNYYGVFCPDDNGEICVVDYFTKESLDNQPFCLYAPNKRHRSSLYKLPLVDRSKLYDGQFEKIEPLYFETFEKCLNCLEYLKRQSKHLTDLFERSFTSRFSAPIDDFICSLRQDNYKCTLFAPKYKDIINNIYCHIQNNNTKCDEILKKSIDYETFHALKNGYIKKL